MNDEQEQDLLDTIKNAIVETLFNKFDDEELLFAAQALIEVAYDLVGDADYFDILCADTSVYYEESRYLQDKEAYNQSILRLCHYGE